MSLGGVQDSLKAPVGTAHLTLALSLSHKNSPEPFPCLPKEIQQPFPSFYLSALPALLPDIFYLLFILHFPFLSMPRSSLAAVLV